MSTSGGQLLVLPVRLVAVEEIYTVPLKIDVGNRHIEPDHRFIKMVYLPHEHAEEQFVSLFGQELVVDSSKITLASLGHILALKKKGYEANLTRRQWVPVTVDDKEVTSLNGYTVMTEQIVFVYGVKASAVLGDLILSGHVDVAFFEDPRVAASVS